jgi:alkaline phosphatase D
MGQFLFRVLDEKKNILDERNLKLLDLEKRDARIAIMSCMMDSNSNKNTMWANVEASDCDLLFFVGDNVYGDILVTFNGPNLLWSRYIETRQKVPYYHWKNLKPAICTWDDHDYGWNNKGGTYKHKHDSLATFKAFTAQDAIDGLESGPGVSSFFKAFGQKFILLDNRFYKGLAYGDIKKGFLGGEQLEWAFEKLSDGYEPNWIMEGSQFFQGQRKGNECYIMDSPEEIEVFKKGIRSLNSPCIFAAGDVHFTEISTVSKDLIGYDTIEITSSSLHSMSTGILPKNENRIHGAVKENFVVIDLYKTQYEIAFDFKCIGMKKVNFEDSFGL